MIKTWRDNQIYSEMTDKTDKVGVADEADKLKFLILEWIKTNNMMNSTNSRSDLTLP